jgi:hypothetical protein
MAPASERRTVARMTPRSLTVRWAGLDDADVLPLVRGRGGAQRFGGRVLLAESDGAPLAAVAVEDGSPAAERFAQHVVRILLQRRAELL